MANHKFFLMCILMMILFSITLIGAPPIPHSIDGTIFTNGSGQTNQVPLGTSYSINDTNTSDYIRSLTNIPVPGLTGRYFETINSSVNDTILIYAWNDTHYGFRNITLEGDMSNVNVIINQTRDPETNVTITTPSSESSYTFGTTFNVTANITVWGAFGSLCNATINFSNPSTLEVHASDLVLHEFGDLNRGDSILTSWNVSAAGTGQSNISVYAGCGTVGSNFESGNSDTITSISVLSDGDDPSITLISPENNTEVTFSYVTFNYEMDDASEIANCSLVINDEINVTNSTFVNKTSTENFSINLDNGYYNWTVRCVDQLGNIGLAPERNLSVAAFGPLISDVYIQDSVILSPGLTTPVWCNATITKISPVVNITFVNATLYDSNAASYSSLDDNNYHYTNTSCINTTDTRYNCLFDLEYYANNASWTCTFGAKGTNNASSTSENVTLINELLSINTTEVIDYGSAEATQVSEIRNITLENLGNKPINISVRGYGFFDGDGYAMTCGVDGDINVTLHRFAVNNSDYPNMRNLSNTNQKIGNFTLFQRTNDISPDNDINSTFWRIQVPTGIGGNCSGTIVITAQHD